MPRSSRLALTTLLVIALTSGVASERARHITAEDVESLKRLCESAREKRIAPLREAEIAECIDKGMKDEAGCRLFFADYGNVVNNEGRVVPRLFHDLAECIEAEEAAKQLRLYPQ